MRVFERGDIVRIDLNPTRGKETHGDFRPCLVVSSKPFNRASRGKNRAGASIHN
ncbi:type II toxin-antitoxin system PemK/MazF family toxin [Idiomarina seosinensis]|uniref:type II toxin-antitoxin system PemK/MazF family toxin n=1 Tax=Idiomarina seosinensis TaxID=281739 RepID=UPI00384FF006